MDCNADNLLVYLVPFPSNRAMCVVVHGVGHHIAAFETIAKYMWENHSIALIGYDQGLCGV